MALRRIISEFTQLQHQAPPYLTAGPLAPQNFFHWQAAVLPPATSIYHGGLFHLDLTFPPDYPFKPPEITFKTKIFHPNISTAGHIALPCISLMWNAQTTIIHIFEQLRLILEKPLDQTLNSEAAILYKTDMVAFQIKAAEWVQLYAS